MSAQPPSVGRVPPRGAAPAGRKKTIGPRSSAIGDAAKPPAALGHKSQNTSSSRGTNEGGELPAGWTKSKLGELLTVIRGVSYKKEHASNEPTPDRLPILRATNIQNGLVFQDLVHVPRHYVSDEQLLRQGDIIIAASSGSRNIVGKAAQLMTDWVGSFGTFCFGLRPKPGVHPRYLAWFLQTSEYRHQVSELSAGVNINNLRATHIEGIPIPVAPLPEQRRIVAEIEKQFTRLEAGVAALRRVQANLKCYRAAVLKAACEGKLVRTEAELARERVGRVPSRGARSHAKSAAWGHAAYNATPYETGEQLLQRILAERRKNWTGGGKYKEPAAPGTANLPVLPEGWTWTNLDAVIASGPHNGVYLPRELYGRGHPILRIDDYQDGWVRGIDELNKVAADQVTANKYQMLSGDLVINRVNSLTHLGKCLVVRETHAGALFESNMMKAHLADCVSPRYVEFCLRSRDGRTRLSSGAKWAVNQASINQEDVKRTPLPLPPPAEQTRIVAEVERRLSVVEELEAVVNANLQRAARLRQSILQKAFTGEIA